MTFKSSDKYPADESISLGKDLITFMRARMDAGKDTDTDFLLMSGALITSLIFLRDQFVKPDDLNYFDASVHDFLIESRLP